MKVARTRRLVALATFALVAGFAVSPAFADTVTFGGLITQSTSDGTGPAVNNPGLNAILDGDAYSITLNFTGSITGAGTFALSGVGMVFIDPSAAAIESAFSSVSFSVAPSGSSDQLSLLGCLTTGSGCLFGNYLALNFMIPSAGLNLQNVTASSIPGLTPLDLPEDNGTTDIQGTVTSYSYLPQEGMSTVPEPGTMLLLASGILIGSWKRSRLQAGGSDTV